MIKKVFGELVKGFYNAVGIEPQAERLLWIFVNLTMDRVLQKLTLLAESGDLDKLNNFMDELRDELIDFHKKENEIAQTILKQYEESITCDG